jgi:hypothetical protein
LVIVLYRWKIRTRRQHLDLFFLPEIMALVVAVAAEVVTAAAV